MLFFQKGVKMTKQNEPKFDKTENIMKEFPNFTKDVFISIDVETFDFSPYTKQNFVWENNPEIKLSILYPKNNKFKDIMVLITNPEGSVIFPVFALDKKQTK